MEDIYSSLLKEMGSLREAEEEISGVDAFLSTDKIKVASMDDLLNFFRLSNDTLVHKAQKDLWRISEANGQMIIERLFDPETKQPIKV